MRKSMVSREINEAFDFCSYLDVPGTFVPSHLSMFINRTQDIALWESIYVHETVHSLLTDSLNGWWIELLEDISNNMFVVFRRGDVLNEKLVSWILNLEFKRRKLVDSWMQTQEGFATYFQLDVIDIKKRAVSVETELKKMSRKNITEEEIHQIENRVDEIRNEWLNRISSRNCPQSYWKGYELVKLIARKFGKENLAPVAMAACSIRFPDSLMAQDIERFQEMISQEKYNVDKRLELISQIPECVIEKLPLVNDWMSLTQKILQYLGEEPLQEEFDFLKMTRDNYTNPAFPEEFVEIAKKEMPNQLKKSSKRWKNLKAKGIDSSQLVALFNVEGDAAMISDFDLVNTTDTDKVLAMTYRSIFNGLDKIAFINDLLKSLRKRNKIEEWMKELVGFGDLTRLRDMFHLRRLLSLGEACLLCHNPAKYSNPGLMCPYSNIHICVNCCMEMGCSSCQRFSAKRKIILEIERIIRSFSYEL